MVVEDRDWGVYFERAGTDPRATLLDAVARFAEPGLAVDLGCGAGRDTFELLRRGWRVVAIDAEQRAIDRVRANAPPGELETVVAPMEEAEWPACDLVNSSFALPFVSRDRFADVWARIVDSLPTGGRFAGQLFGDRDEWADKCVTHPRAEAESLLAPFERERFDEEEADGTIVTGAPKHWHVFHVVARKR